MAESRTLDDYYVPPPRAGYVIQPPTFVGYWAIERERLTNERWILLLQKGHAMWKLINTPLSADLESIQSKYVQSNYAGPLEKNHWIRLYQPGSWTILNHYPSVMAPALKDLGISSLRTDWIAASWKYNTMSFYSSLPSSTLVTEPYYGALFSKDAMIIDQMFAPLFSNDDETKQFPDLRHWSDFAFLEWQAYLLTLGLTDGNIIPYPQIMIMHNITNYETIAAWGTILDIKRADGYVLSNDFSWEKRMEVSHKDGDAFLVMMGTPIVKAVAWFLISHKAQFGNAVKVDKIALWGADEGDVSMCFWIGE